MTMSAMSAKREALWYAVIFVQNHFIRGALGSEIYLRENGLASTALRISRRMKEILN